MRTAQTRTVCPTDLRRRIERLDGLPLRAPTARFVLAETPEESDEPRPDSPRRHSATEFDPGWVLAFARSGPAQEPLGVVADRPWWPPTSPEGAEALLRHWRHSVAVGLAARRLAREADDPDPERLGCAGLLHGLGRWAVASVDPDWLARWLAAPDRHRRREYEERTLGIGVGTLGRVLAERWGCDPLVADAAWLHDEPGLEGTGDDPARLRLLQQAFRLAERTPWALDPEGAREPSGTDPRVKLLTAEVQSRCGAPFSDPDPGREEGLTQSNARLRLRVAELLAGQATRDRFLAALAASEPAEAPETWADRASLAWCAEPGVTAARVVWQGPTPRPPCPEPEAGSPPPPERPPAAQLPLESAGRRVATVQLWSSPALGHGLKAPEATVPAWRAWGAIVAERARLEERVRRTVTAYRLLAETEEVRLRAEKLAALAEFAAGAGHELNNPLAVIVGRAQLLLVGQSDPKVARSLRAILTQAQRAHRILRDLMYVARPPEPRPRFCQPDEIVRASLRDARADADDRQVRIAAESLDHATRIWADADGLRHLADSLVRNAVEATPKGGVVRFTTGGDASSLRWTVHDGGRGITPAEGAHLFDPFYCGRQAGRGLGMGLPRAARFLAQLGGEIRWQSTPGQGSTFQIRLPLDDAPGPPAVDREAGPAAGLTAEARPASA